MIDRTKFSVGDRVIVFQNSERVHGLIGSTGVIVGFRSNDAIVRFNNGGEHFIYENDLKNFDTEKS